MAAIANELADDVMQHAFSDGLVEQIVRPLDRHRNSFQPDCQTSSPRSGRPPAGSVVPVAVEFDPGSARLEDRELKNSPHGNVHRMEHAAWEAQTMANRIAPSLRCLDLYPDVVELRDR